MSLLHPDRLFPPDPTVRAIARALYEGVRELPIISPHGHCDPSWFARNEPFSDPAALMIQPDHYLLRMMISQGVSYQDLGIGAKADPRAVWRRFAACYPLFAGTPSRLWLDYTFSELFGLTAPLTEANADAAYDRIAECLADPAFRPRTLFERFGIEMLATTEGALDPLAHHAAIRASGWGGNVVTTYRPDSLCDPDHPDFHKHINELEAVTSCNADDWPGYLEAHRRRRAFFRDHGAVATDHGTPDAMTLDLSQSEAAALYSRVRSGEADARERAAFRAQMLTEMARMSVEDGMVMQIHPGSRRNHSAQVFAKHGPDRGFDIPGRTDFVEGLRPLLNAVGHAPGLRIVVFTLDESTYARELAPLAGAYPALLLGPPWWFFDSPDGIARFREAVTETAGFHNTVGFNDDTRAFPSIPARHDMARRCDCAFLAARVADHRLREDEAHEIARLLTVDLPRRTYRLADA